MPDQLLFFRSKPYRMFRSDEEGLLEFTGAETSRDYYSIYYLVQGLWVLQVDGRRQVLKPGDVFFVWPDSDCTTHIVDDVSGNCLLLQIQTRDMENLMNVAGRQDFLPLLLGVHLFHSDGIEKAWLSQCFSLLFADRKKGDRETERLGNAIITTVLLDLLKNGGFDTAKATARTDKKGRSMLDVALFIDEHYKERITMAMICQIYSLTPSMLSRDFKHQFQISPVHYLNRARVAAAKQLISTEPWRPLSEVCEEVGYESLTYFGRVFKKATGQTPSEYRQRINKKPHS